MKALGLESKNSAFRREFRIGGNIGTTTGCITYISLCSQIDEGRKGYGDDDITMAVKKAVTAGSELRTILDAKTKMPLDTVLNFIRSFMKEKTATELCRDLSELVQKDSEEPQVFVLRAMELREKILVAPIHEGTVQYEKSQVQDMFIHTIRTGLKSANVRAKLVGVLRRDTEDEQLMSEISAAAIEESKRVMKQTNSAKKTTATTAGASASEGLSELSGIIRSLKDDVNSLRKEVADLKKGNNQPSQSEESQNHYMSRGCHYCRRDGHGDSCRHCWICGAGDHLAQYCRKQQNSRVP